jgi:hypothetical protein
MISLLLALAVGTSTPRSPSPRVADDTPAWMPILAYEEVRVEADTAGVTGTGPHTLWLRWSFLERASSPTAWDAGVRASVDLVQIDCVRGAMRTFSSMAYGADGSAVAAASYDEPAAAWRTARPESIAGLVVEQVCGIARARR